MSDIWKAPTEIQDMVLELIGQYHPDLALLSEEIVVMFRSNTPTRGGRKVYGQAMRSTARINALSGTDYKFLIELSSDAWENDLGSRQREALLDHCLMQCRAEEDSKSGETRCSIARPDIQMFTENISRYGMWFPKEDLDEDDDGMGPDDKTGSETVGESVNGE